jgi:excisionase family DNA binding protein
VRAFPRHRIFKKFLSFSNTYIAPVSFISLGGNGPRMIMTALAKAFDEAGTLTPESIDAAASAARMLSRFSSATCVQLAIEGEAQNTIALPADIFGQIVDLLTKIANGNAVSIVPIDAELTTQQAAHFLNVSRPHVIKLIERGDLPHRMVGTHRKVPARAVLTLRDRTEAAQAAAIQYMAEFDADRNLEDDALLDDNYVRPE